MNQENIMFSKNQDKSCTMTDLCSYSTFFGYKDSYNYYDIDVDKILLFRKCDDESIIRYYDVDKMIIAPLQLKIKNFSFGELHMFANNITMVPIHSDGKELCRKCREIWNKIIEFIGINNTPDFVETTLDDGNEFIMVDVEKNATAVKDNDKNRLVIVLHSVFSDYPETLVQYRY